jgi:DNA-binding response OmpR family regulator
VEDDPRTQNLERFILEDEGYVVAVASSGEDALRALKESTPALVLLDIGLPGMDGFATCQRIRESSQVPIIMVTGQDSDEDKVRGLEMGADDYLGKPFSANVLVARVRAVLRRYALTPPAAPVQEPERQSAGERTQGDGAAEESSEQLLQPSDDTVYEGSVRLMVEAAGPLRQLVRFVDELRQKQEFHLLRLVARQSKAGMDIWLTLREPLVLKAALLGMQGVSRVDALPVHGLKSDEHQFRVLLGQR